MGCRRESVDFPGRSDGKSVCLQCRRPGFDSWVGKIPGEGNGNPLQCSCLENAMGRGHLQATVPDVAKKVGQHLVTKQQP